MCTADHGNGYRAQLSFFGQRTHATHSTIAVSFPHLLEWGSLRLTEIVYTHTLEKSTVQPDETIPCPRNKTRNDIVILKKHNIPTILGLPYRNCLHTFVGKIEGSTRRNNPMS